MLINYFTCIFSFLNHHLILILFFIFSLFLFLCLNELIYLESNNKLKQVNDELWKYEVPFNSLELRIIHFLNILFIIFYLPVYLLSKYVIIWVYCFVLFRLIFLAEKRAVRPLALRWNSRLTWTSWGSRVFRYSGSHSFIYRLCTIASRPNVLIGLLFSLCYQLILQWFIIFFFLFFICISPLW
jgi:hypothetical protein